MNGPVFLCIAYATGWLAGLMMKSLGFGLLGNLPLGVLGALIDSNGIVASLITTTTGAILVLAIAGSVSKSWSLQWL
ncbi:MAG: GlsB/YeaQ/YmgE family stress response membrane protein [Candidatus Thiodiazotropha sp.]